MREHSGSNTTNDNYYDTSNDTTMWPRRFPATGAYSARPCGCDPAERHVCDWHQKHDIVQEQGPQRITRDVQQGVATPHEQTAINSKDVRKTYPVASGVLDYFPLALREVAHVSYVGNEQHNPGTPLHWDRTKSTDEADALTRHLLERGTFDTDGLRHTAKVAWRALALLQKELEATKPAIDRIMR